MYTCFSSSDVGEQMFARPRCPLRKFDHDIYTTRRLSFLVKLVIAASNITDKPACPRSPSTAHVAPEASRRPRTRTSQSVHSKNVTASPSLNSIKSCQATCSPVQCREVSDAAASCSPVASVATLSLRSVVFNYFSLSQSYQVRWPGRHSNFTAGASIGRL